MVLAIVQARMSSMRLPGKVLMPILDRPMLWRQLERLGQATRIDRLVLATSDQSEDQPLVEMSREFGVDCYTGSLNDVLDRFYQAARRFQTDHVVRLTGDCPLIDAAVVDRAIEYHLAGGYDYVSNVHPPTYPDGLDVEVMRFEGLKQAWRESELPSQREHVTPFVYTDLSQLRWTVDEPADFEFVTRIYESLHPDDPQFSTAAVLDLLQARPDLSELNRGFDRNEGLEKSIMQDKTRGSL
jgi:spore coat polysaccharide biosynthesis protein SpsF